MANYKSTLDENTDNFDDLFQKYPNCKASILIKAKNSSKFLEIDSPEAKMNDSELISCRRCNEKNPLIWQRQTRSADEPMTVFFMCKNNNCGFRWKQ